MSRAEWAICYADGSGLEDKSAGAYKRNFRLGFHLQRILHTRTRSRVVTPAGLRAWMKHVRAVDEARGGGG